MSAGKCKATYILSSSAGGRSFYTCDKPWGHKKSEHGIQLPDGTYFTWKDGDDK